MTDHQARRIAAIAEIHHVQMYGDDQHRLLCNVEPCAIALLLGIVSTQSKKLASVHEVAITCSTQAELMERDAKARGRRATVSAHKAAEVLDDFGRVLGGILSGAVTKP